MSIPGFKVVSLGAVSEELRVSQVVGFVEEFMDMAKPNMQALCRRVGVSRCTVFLLSMQLCTSRVCWAQHRVSVDLPGMDVAMQTSAMQMLVLIVAATLQHAETREDVEAVAQKLHTMIPALYHLHSLIT